MASDPLGKRPLMQAWFALTVSVVLTLLTVGLFALGHVSATILLVLSLPLGVWSGCQIRRAESAGPQRER
jgi:hypothetical protein